MNALRWRKVSDYAMESDAGGYCVCRKSVWGQLWFEAWRGKEQIDLAAGEDSAAMRAVCQADFDKRKQQEKAA